MAVSHTGQFIPACNSETRALRFVASAHIPTGKLQWKRRLVFSEESCDTLSQDIRLLHTAAHYRQARYNSRNLFSVATRFPVVNQIRAKKCGDVAFRSRGRKSQLGMRIRVRRIRRLRSEE